MEKKLFDWDEICKEKVRTLIDGIVSELRTIDLLGMFRTGHAELSTKVLGKNYRDAVRDRYRKTSRGMDLVEINDWYDSIEAYILAARITTPDILRALKNIKVLFDDYRIFVSAEPWNTRKLLVNNRVHPRSLLIEVIRKAMPKVANLPMSNKYLSILLFGDPNYLGTQFLHTLKAGEEGRVNPGILFEIMYRISEWQIFDFKAIEGVQTISKRDLEQLQTYLRRALKRFSYLNYFSADYIRYGYSNLGYDAEFFKPELDLLISLYFTCRSQNSPHIVAMLRNKGDIEYLTMVEITEILGEKTILYDRIRDGYFFQGKPLRRIMRGFSKLLPQSFSGNDYNSYVWYFEAKSKIKQYIKQRNINLFPKSTSNRAQYHPDFYKDETIRDQVWEMLIDQLGIELLIYNKDNDRLDGALISDIEVYFNDHNGNYEVVSGFERHHIFWIKKLLETKYLVLTGQSHNTRISHPSQIIGGYDHVFMAMANWHYKKTISRLSRSKKLTIKDLPVYWSQEIKNEYINRWNYLRENGETAFIQKYYPQYFVFYVKNIQIKIGPKERNTRDEKEKKTLKQKI